MCIRDSVDIVAAAFESVAASGILNDLSLFHRFHQTMINAQGHAVAVGELREDCLLYTSEFELIKYPERGTCLYRCGNERYLLPVIAPEYKAVIFGKAGGR